MAPYRAPSISVGEHEAQDASATNGGASRHDSVLHRTGSIARGKQKMDEADLKAAVFNSLVSVGPVL